MPPAVSREGFVRPYVDRRDHLPRPGRWKRVHVWLPGMRPRGADLGLDELSKRRGRGRLQYSKLEPSGTRIPEFPGRQPDGRHWRLGYVDVRAVHGPLLEPRQVA